MSREKTIFIRNAESHHTITVNGQTVKASGAHVPDQTVELRNRLRVAFCQYQDHDTERLDSVFLDATDQTLFGDGPTKFLILGRGTAVEIDINDGMEAAL